MFEGKEVQDKVQHNVDKQLELGPVGVTEVHEAAHKDETKA